MKKILFLLSISLFFGLGSLSAKPKNVECIAPAGAGGGWDFTCRVPAAEVMPKLGLVDGNIKVTNMSGAGGGVAYSHVVSNRKGEENLIVAASMATAARLGQNVYAGLTQDQVRWLGALGADYGVIAVGKKSPYKTLKDLLNALSKNPGKNPIVGGSAAGGWDHLKVLLVAQEAGNKKLKSINYIAFDNGAKAILEVLGGRAAAFTGDTSEVLSYYDSGDLRILAVLAPEKVDRLGSTPTAKELGYDVIGANWRGFYAPQGISDKAYKQWVDIIRKVSGSAEWNKLRESNGLAKFESFGGDFEGFVKKQIAAVKKLSQDLGFMNK